MRPGILAAALLLATSASAAVADLVMPDPALSPEVVIEIQLSALQANDIPKPDAGIMRTWAFAHPDNKRMTGPLPRFAQMIKGPLYQMLLNHRSHDQGGLSLGLCGCVRGHRYQPNGRGRWLSLERCESSRGCECRRVDDHRRFSAGSCR